MLRVWAGLQALTDGFLVYGELLSVREGTDGLRARAVTTIQVVRLIKKYLADNPGRPPADALT